MRRIAFALCLAALPLPALAEDLRGAFYALPKSERMVVQTNLAEADLYTGVIDGLWGPGTAGALDAAQDSLAWPGYRSAAGEAGMTRLSDVLWAYVADPAMAASIAVRR